MNQLKSLSIFVGTGECNAKCAHCAGIIHRKYAPKKDGVVDECLINRTLRVCYEQGARRLSISSSGEPTSSPLSVTRVLELTDRLRKEGVHYNPVNLYTNGIRIGEEDKFCKNYLDLWKTLGLTTVYVTVHDIDERENARIYGVDSYPRIERILVRVHGAGLMMRANLVLSKNSMDIFEKFKSTVEYLINVGTDFVSAWPIRGLDDKVDLELAPLDREIDKMEKWIKESKKLNGKVVLLREKSKIAYQTGQKLTLFPDGTLSNTWCN